MRSFLLSLALLCSGTVLAAEGDHSRFEDDARFAFENGATLRAFDSPKEIRASLTFFERVLDIDARAETKYHGDAIAALDEAKARLRELAEPDRDHAMRALEADDIFEAERYLFATLAIDPFDTASALALARVQSALRREAVELHRLWYPRFRIGVGGLGVPPGFETITNDPKFSRVPSPTDRG